jgi:antitoxin component of RelBE/YafQ-DinJ toxin-antitoxin module
MDKVADTVALVSARVPKEIRRQGNVVLERIGATPTQLVNAAYQYVIEHGALPATKKELSPANRTLSVAQLNKLKARSLRMALPGSELALKNRDLKELLAEGRLADYESLT